MKSILIVLTLAVCLSFNAYCQNQNSNKLLLIRCDDIGMSHAVNMAVKELIESGLIF